MSFHIAETQTQLLFVSAGSRERSKTAMRRRSADTSVALAETMANGFVTLFGACGLSVLPVAINHGKDKLQRLPLSLSRRASVSEVFASLSVSPCFVITTFVHAKASFACPRLRMTKSSA